MKTENKTEQARLEYFKSLYENAKTNMSGKLEELERYMRQYRGSPEIDGSSDDASTVRNITYEIVESQVSAEIPMPKADPSSYSEHRSRNAETIERLCRSVRDRLPFERLNDMDERYTYIYGGSVWYVEWDNEGGRPGEGGGVQVHCLSPKDFIPQPGIFEVEDMEYCFLTFNTTRAALARKYQVDYDRLELAEVCYEYEKTSSEEDTVCVVLCFYKDEDGDVCRFIFSGDLTLSDLPKYYHRKLLVCADCGADAELCNCGSRRRKEQDTDYEQITKPIKLNHGSQLPAFSPKVSHGMVRVCDDGPLMEQTTVPYYFPRKFPIVIRKNTSAECSLLGQSDCEYIRPQQQSINKIESRILQKLVRACVTPVVPEDASISVNNQLFGQVIKMKPGESASQYGKVDTTPNIAQDIAEAERLYDQAKRIIGISDAFQGIDTGMHESGVAKQLRISQATGRLQSKRKMKDFAYSSIDRIIFELYLAFADEPRQLSYKDAYGRVHNAEFSRYDFLDYDLQEGKYYYDDDYLFSVDMNDGSDLSRESLWQKNLENLKAGTLGNPESPVTLLRYWQAQEMAHYPHARENVEYFIGEVERMRGGEVLGEEGKAPDTGELSEPNAFNSKP